MQPRWLFIAGLVIVGLVAVLAPGLVRADDGPLRPVGSAAVMPLDNYQVQMVAERVEAELTTGSAQVTCVFTFTNAGTATTVLMGFPEARRRAGGDPLLKDFRAFVDGQEVGVTYRPQAEPGHFPDYAGWHTFSVSFETGQTRTVRNTYWGELSFDSSGTGFFNYILQTGSGWAGVIERADIAVRWSRQRGVTVDAISAHPSGYTREGYELHWTFRDFEPTPDHDISVFFSPAVSPSSGGIASASSGGAVSEWFGRFQPGAPFDGHQPLAAWVSGGETTGAWILWSSGYEAYRVGPTLGLGILPGLYGSDFYEHGRPKEILVRLATWKDENAARPFLEPEPGIFQSPSAGVEIRQVRFTLRDDPGWQFLRLDEYAVVLAFQVGVESVYPGQRYDDVAIAGVWLPVLEGDLATSFSFLPGTGGGGPIEAERGVLAQPALRTLVAALGALLIVSGAAIRLRLRCHHG